MTGKNYKKVKNRLIQATQDQDMLAFKSLVKKEADVNAKYNNELNCLDMCF